MEDISDYDAPSTRYIRVSYGLPGLLIAALLVVAVAVTTTTVGAVLGYQAGYDKGVDDGQRPFHQMLGWEERMK